MNINQLLERMELALGTYRQRLYEFAMPLKTLKDKIQDKTPIIFLHLYKIIAFGKDNPTTVHHWCAELGGFLKICNIKVKGNNKLLDAKTITNIMLEVYSDVKEFGSLGGELYSEYGYAELKDSEIYNIVKTKLPNVISYIQSLGEDERVNPNKMEEILC